MEQIKIEDGIGHADEFKIIFADKCINVHLGDERRLDYTFEDVMDEAKRNGWKSGTILLIAESPLSGKIYEYGNYGDFWVEYGTTKGYT